MRRATVAGEGAVCALGSGVRALFDGVFAGRSGLRALRRLAGTECLTSVAGEVAVVEDERGLPLQLAELAAREALGGRDPAELALVVSTTKGDLRGVTRAQVNPAPTKNVSDPVGAGFTPARVAGLGSPAALADRLAEALGCGGPRLAVSCACSSGLSAIAAAARWIALGRTDAALVVGVDALSAFVLRGFSALLALDPEPCRPFDAGRRGLSLGEGAGALLLVADGQGPWVAGWGESNDANHVTGPSRDGAGLALAADRALTRAGLAPADVDLVHLHGTGTRYNDASEALAMVGLFGGETPSALGTKAVTGHTLGAAGVLETLVVLEALRRGEAPANLGLGETDVDTALRLTREPTPLSRSRTALKVCAGFGGINAALVLRTGGPK